MADVLNDAELRIPDRMDPTEPLEEQFSGPTDR